MIDFEKNHWNNRYATGSNSGTGSYGEQLEKKLKWLGTIKHDVNSITEVGCGDFNFGSHVLENFKASYVGLDVSDYIVAKNKILYPNYVFDTYPKVIPKADLLLCVDVFFHVIEDEEMEKLLDDLEKSWSKYLCVTAYERNEEKTNHVRIRKFFYERFGEPIIREVVEEDGQLYFYLFKK